MKRSHYKGVRFGSIAFVLLAVSLAACADPSARTYDRPLPPPPGPSPLLLSFSVAADMRGFTGEGEFRAALAVLAQIGPGSFMLVPGDFDPPEGVRSAISGILGPSFPWLPVIGNHEADTPTDMSWLRAYDLAAQAGSFAAANMLSGPSGAAETCYSFDAGGAHFIAINEYYDGTSDTGLMAGDIDPALLAWLAADLEEALSREPAPNYLFIIGHEPAYVMPDEESGRIRHLGDSLDASPARRDAFWALLAAREVSAYICGHTHNFSMTTIDGVLQIDAGHARGSGDRGAPSTVLIVRLYAEFAAITAYRTTVWGDFERTGTVYLLPRK